jgi:hypothetical protein
MKKSVSLKIKIRLGVFQSSIENSIHHFSPIFVSVFSHLLSIKKSLNNIFINLVPKTKLLKRRSQKQVLEK